MHKRARARALVRVLSSGARARLNDANVDSDAKDGPKRAQVSSQMLRLRLRLRGRSCPNAALKFSSLVWRATLATHLFRSSAFVSSRNGALRLPDAFASQVGRPIRTNCHCLGHSSRTLSSPECVPETFGSFGCSIVGPPKRHLLRVLLEHVNIVSLYLMRKILITCKLSACLSVCLSLPTD